MRWQEIITHAAETGHTAPTYRQLDVWTRGKLLRAEMRGDRHGRYRWWPAREVEAALLVARLISVGMGVDLAFQVARTKPDGDGVRSLILDGADRPHITVSVAAS